MSDFPVTGSKKKSPVTTTLEPRKPERLKLFRPVLVLEGNAYEISQLTFETKVGHDFNQVTKHITGIYQVHMTIHTTNPTDFQRLLHEAGHHAMLGHKGEPLNDRLYITNYTTVNGSTFELTGVTT